MNKTIYILLITLTVILFLPIIVYYSSILYMNKFHKFWSKQPVSFYHSLYLNEGIIKNDLSYLPIIDNEFLVEKFDISSSYFDDIVLLLNNNYSLHSECVYNYNIDYLKNNFKNDLEKESKINLLLLNKKDKKLLGCLISRPISINLKGKKINCLYVDFLCVDNNYRSKGLAPILISNLRYYGFLNGYNVFIYQKEGKPLPVRSIGLLESNIYELQNLNLGEIKLETMNDTNQKQIYYFFMNNLKKKENYIDFSYIDFIIKFKNEWTNIYIESKNNQLINLVILQDNKYSILNKKVIDMQYIIMDDNLSFEEKEKFIKKIIHISYNNSFKLICNKNKFNKIFFNDLRPITNFITYIYLYNYNLITPIFNHQFIF